MLNFGYFPPYNFNNHAHLERYDTLPGPLIIVLCYSINTILIFRFFNFRGVIYGLLKYSIFFLEWRPLILMGHIRCFFFFVLTYAIVIFIRCSNILWFSANILICASFDVIAIDKNEWNEYEEKKSINSI